MMQNLLLEEGDLVTIRSATLPKGTFVKLQPHTKDFLDISNPRAVLERTLRSYSCLTVKDTICLHYNNKRFYIDIIDAKPQVGVARMRSAFALQHPTCLLHALHLQMRAFMMQIDDQHQPKSLLLLRCSRDRPT